MGRRGYTAEFRQRVLDLVAAGRRIEDIARDLGISDQTVYSWRRQARIIRLVTPWTPAFRGCLRRARRRGTNSCFIRPVVRHRLNRGGDRQLNPALHTIVMWRMDFHAEGQAYTHRRRAEGKSDREIKRCLKRHLARRIFRLLNGLDSL